MKLVRCRVNGGERIGVLAGGAIAATAYQDLPSFIADGPEALESARRALEAGARVTPDRMLVPLVPGKILFCGINYPSHLDENPGATLPAEPFFFAKLPSAVIGPGDPIVLPYPECQVDYEVELAVVIGRRARGLSRDEALTAVFGYTVVNDVSARDVQFTDNQITLGKGFDSFCPLGPCVVTTDELSDPSGLEVLSRVNGEERQREETARMLFDVPALLTALTRYITLEPGDLVSTGTPAGVAHFRPGRPYLEPGDHVEVEVSRVGVLGNPVVAGWK